MPLPDDLTTLCLLRWAGGLSDAQCAAAKARVIAASAAPPPAAARVGGPRGVAKGAGGGAESGDSSDGGDGGPLPLFRGRPYQYRATDRFPGARSYRGCADTTPAYECLRPGASGPIREKLFVKSFEPGSVSPSTWHIPFGKWETMEWYMHRLEEASGIPAERMRLLFAGGQRDPGIRHSGLSRESTLHCVIGKPPPVAAFAGRELALDAVLADEGIGAEARVDALVDGDAALRAALWPRHPRAERAAGKRAAPVPGGGARGSMQVFVVRQGGGEVAVEVDRDGTVADLCSAFYRALHPAAPFPVVHAALAQLVEMGFPRAAAEAVLREQGGWEGLPGWHIRAIDRLLQQPQP